MYATLSDSMTRNMISSTMAGAKAAVKMAAAALDQMPSAEDTESSDVEESDPVDATRVEVTTKQPFESAYRFRFEEEDLQQIRHIGSKGSLPPAMPMSRKFGGGLKFKDDGSNWVVDHATSSGSRKRSLTPKHSGSSWGGGSALLEPICQGKVTCDEPVKVVLPKHIPRPQASMLS